jgi:hypothetical protein
VIRRYPALLWILVYVGSVLILNGTHGKIDPLELGLGIGGELLALGLGLYILLSPWEGHPRPTPMFWLLGGTAAFYLICATAGWILDNPGTGIATLLAGGIPMTAVVLWAAHVRAGTAPAADEDEHADATVQDNRDPVPAIGGDDSRPLGDTPEAHDEISPHDLPPGHPGREAAEDMAREEGGVTGGHREGGAAGGGGRFTPAEDERVPLDEQKREKPATRVRR